jgi:Tol biopolymer transport system component
VVLFDRLGEAGIHIFRVGLDGSDPRQLTSGKGEQVAAVSRDGRFAAYSPFDDTAAVRLLGIEDGSDKPFATGVSTIVGFSPDSTLLLLGQPAADDKGLERLVWKAFPVAGGAPVASYAPPPAAVAIAWSPDSRGLTYRNRAEPAWNVYRLDVGAEAPVQLTRFTEGRLTAHAWSPDGQRLAVAQRTDDGGRVWVSGPDGARPVEVARFPATDVFRIAWLPDSRRLAVSAGTLTRDAVLIRAFR